MAMNKNHNGIGNQGKAWKYLRNGHARVATAVERITTK